MYKTVLFDLDGTVMDTGEGITNAIKYGLEKCGLPPLSMDIRKKFIGPPLRNSFKKYCGIDDEGVEKVVSEYREYYAAHGHHECKPYEGIRELLEKLKDEGRALCVATLKYEKASKVMLDEWDFSKYFEKIVGADVDKGMDNKTKIIKSALDGEECGSAVMIGDVANDIYAARANNIDAVGVLYGYGDRDALIEAKPDYLVKNVFEIYGVISAKTTRC